MARHFKINKRTLIKSIVLSLFGVATIGLIVGLSVDWSFPSWIYISGSSTMQQFLQSVSDIYKPSEVIVDAGGSSVGVDNLINGKKNIASSSKSPSKSTAGVPAYDNNAAINGKYEQQWNDEKIKTLSIAFDAIGIVYKDDKILNNSDIVINPNTIKWLYLAFAGYSPVNVFKLIPNSQFSNQNDSKYNLVPFARTGGSVQSGTAESFLLDSNLLKNENGYNDSAGILSEINAKNESPIIDKDNTQLNDSLYTILHSGEYGPYVKTTSESNLQTWQSIKNYSGSGIPITYLSSGFIINNYNDIINSGFKVALYNCSSDSNQSYKLDKDNIAAGYNWYRPMNLILSCNSEEYIKNFIEWILANMLFENSYISNIYEAQGFIPLDAKTLLTMFNPSDDKGIELINDLSEYAKNNPNSNYDEYINNSSNKNIDELWNNFWEIGDDYSLIQSNEYSQRESLDIWYGAYKV